MKYTQSSVDKLEDILGESAYVVRYERGTFQSGWCLLEARKVVVLNKFLNTGYAKGIRNHSFFFF